MATAMERKFTSLRKRLDQMGYRQPLGVESLPLAERLFGDLLHTTESLKNTKVQLSKQKEQKGLWEKQSEPYRADNARLIRENSEVHQQLLSVKEGFEGRIRDLKAALRRFEHENADLKFLNTQYMQRLMAQERESQAKSEKILELQEKNFQAVIQTPGGRKKQVASRRQRMEIDSLLAEKSNLPSRLSSDTTPKLPEPDPYIADLLKVADDRIAGLQRQLKEGEVEKKSLLESIDELTKQVERREGEVQRLIRQLKGGRPPEALASEDKTENNAKMVAHMNIQIDFLQQRNQELETKLAEDDTAKSELQVRADGLASKNARICSELKEIGELVKQMERERESGESALREEVEERKKECNELKNRGEQLLKEKRDLEQREQQLLGDNQRMAQLLATSEEDSEQAATLLERLNKEKKMLTQECQQLKKKDQALQRRVEELDREKERLEKRSSGKIGEKHSPEVSRLKKERDEMIVAVERMEQELSQLQEELQNLTEERDNIKLLYEQVTEQLTWSHRDPSSSPTTALHYHHEREIADLQLELQRVKSERSVLKERLRSTSDDPSGNQGELERRNEELEENLEKVTQKLSGERGKVASLQKAVWQLEGELKQVRTELGSAQDERRRSRERASRLQGMVDAGEKTKKQQKLGILQQSADSESARMEVARLTTRLNHLERELQEKEEKVKELGEALLVLDQDHDGLRTECDQKDEKIAQLTKVVEERTIESTAKDTSTAHLQGQLTHSQTQLTARDQEISSLRRQLAGSSQELAQLKRDSTRVRETISQLREDLKTMTHESQVLRAELQKVGEEKERLRGKVEEYVKNIAHYEETIAVKDQERLALVQSYQSLSEQAQQLGSSMQLCREQESSTHLHMAALQQEKKHLEELSQQQAVEIEQHLASLQAYEVQLSNTTRSLSAMEQTIRQEQEEKKALLTDLSAMRDLCVQVEKTKESLSRQLASLTVTLETLQQERADIEAERELIKQQLVSERTKVEQLESLLSNERRKEYHSHVTGQERQAELQHIRQQLERVENDRLQLNEQLRKLRSDSVVRGEEIQHLKAELAAEKFQKQHIQQQVNKLRSTVPSTHPLLSPSSLHTLSYTGSSPPANTSPRTIPEVEEAIAKEKQSLASKSAQLVSELASGKSEEQPQ